MNPSTNSSMRPSLHLKPTASSTYSSNHSHPFNHPFPPIQSPIPTHSTAHSSTHSPTHCNNISTRQPLSIHLSTAIYKAEHFMLLKEAT